MKHLLSNHNETTLGPLFDGKIVKAGSVKGKFHSNFSIKDDGIQLRDKGLAQVSEHNENWMFWALDEAEIWVEHTLKDDFTGEDIRRWIESEGLKPNHPNAWGALINTLIKRKIIVPTGEYRAMKDNTSHARKTPVYKAK